MQELEKMSKKIKTKEEKFDFMAKENTLIDLEDLLLNAVNTPQKI